MCVNIYYYKQAFILYFMGFLCKHYVNIYIIWRNILSTTSPTTLRLDTHKKQEYEALAANQGIGLSTYLKNRLEQEDFILEELEGIKRSIEMLSLSIENPDSTNTNEGDKSIQIETLLMLRSIVSPDKRKIISSEMERINLHPYKS